MTNTVSAVLSWVPDPTQTHVQVNMGTVNYALEISPTQGTALITGLPYGEEGKFTIISSTGTVAEGSKPSSPVETSTLPVAFIILGALAILGIFAQSFYDKKR